MHFNPFNHLLNSKYPKPLPGLLSEEEHLFSEEKEGEREIQKVVEKSALKRFKGSESEKENWLKRERNEWLATNEAINIAEIDDVDAQGNITEVSPPRQIKFVKPYQAAEKSIFQKFLGVAIEYASPIIGKVVNSYDTFDKEKVIADQKQEMLAQLQDPHFVEFYEMINQVLLPTIKEQVLASLAIKGDQLSQTIASQEKVILKLLEVILARGFANLARQVQENKDSIPHFDQQPSLVSVLSFLCQQAGQHISQRELEKIEVKYQQVERDLTKQIRELFPEIENQPESKRAFSLYIQEYLTITNPERKEIIKKELFLNHDLMQEEVRQKIHSFFKTLDKLHLKNRELHQQFSHLSGNLLLSLFPHKLSDIKEIEGYLSYLFGDMAFDAIQDVVANLLRETYESLENNQVRNERWETSLNKRLGAPNLQPIIQAPSAFLMAFARDSIQSNPTLMKMIGDIIDDFMHPTVVSHHLSENGFPERQKKALNQLSQQQLANWLIETGQVLLRGEDRHLSGLAQFITQALNHLTLALIAKGAELVIPEGEGIEPHAFIKEFSERVIAKMGNLQGEEVFSEQFWQNFVNDLPLPPLVKGGMVSFLVEKSKSLQLELKTRSRDFEEIKRVYEDAYQKILSYEEGGEQLLAIAKRVSDQIIEQVLERNLDWVSTLGFDDSIEELFVHYLPGVKISEELKMWFKTNITHLGADEEPSYSIVLLKEGVQAIILKAMANAIESNFQGNGRDYAAQLLTNVQGAFFKAFANFDAEQREQLDRALLIQSELNRKNQTLQSIQERIARKPIGITEAQELLLGKVIGTHMRYVRASETIENLRAKEEKVLAQLNLMQKRKIWTAADFPAVGEALVLRKIEEHIYPSEELYKNHLEAKIAYLEEFEKSGNLSEESQRELQQRQLLLILKERTPGFLQKLSEAIHVHATVQHAEKELHYLREELERLGDFVASYEEGDIENREEWQAATHWTHLVLHSKQEIKAVYRDITHLEEELDRELSPFQSLSRALTGVLGWNRKEDLELPPFLQDQVWPLIESIQDKQLARLLFTHITPLLITILDVPKQREELEQLSNGNLFLGQFLHVVSQDVVAAIKNVAIDPQEIVEAIRAVIPEAVDLHALIVPQIQAIVVEEEAPFQRNRDILQTFLEGALLGLFVKIAKANQGNGNPLIVITHKLQELARDAIPQPGQTAEMVAEFMIDRLFADILDIHSQEDLGMIPASLRQVAYEKLKEQAYQQLMPFALPIVERNQQRAMLQERSGSDFMGYLCTALSKDVFTIIPRAISPEKMAASIGAFLPHLDLHLQHALAQEIGELIQGDSDAYLNGSAFIATYIEGVLLQLFTGIAEKNPPNASKDSILILIENVLNIVTMKYQEAKGDKDFSDVAKECNNAIMQNVLGIDSPEAFRALPDALQPVVYDAIKGQLGEMLIRIQRSLSTLDNHHKTILQAKEKVKQFGIADKAIKGYVQILAEDLANMVVVSVPHVLAEVKGESRKGVVTIAKNIESYLEELAHGHLRIADTLLKYPQSDQLKEMLEGDLGTLANSKQLIEDKQKVADVVGNLLVDTLGKTLERVHRFEIKHQKRFNQQVMANILHIGAEHLKHLNDARELAAREGRKGIQHQDFVGIVGDQLHPAVPIAPVTYQKTIESIAQALYGQLTPDQENRWLDEQENLRALIAEMIKQEVEGEQVIHLEEFIKRFKPIHERIMEVPLTDAQRDALLRVNASGFTLRDLMRQEFEVPTVQREEAFYGETTEAVLTLLFPNGKEDLTFVPEELREVVWNLFKKNLFPLLLPMVVELVLDPMMINAIVLNSLENLNETLREEIVLGVPEPVDLPLDELDQVAGELIAEALRAAKTLPPWVKQLLKDPKTGEISDAMKKTLGSTFRSQFNETFIQDKLKIALESAVKRDEEGNPVLSFDTRPRNVIEAEMPMKAEQMEKDLKRVYRDTINVSISYFVRSQWAAFQASFDRLIEKLFGKVGLKIKQGLDVLARLLFIKIIGTLLWYVTYPIRIVLQEVLYEYVLRLDENRQHILDLLNQVPEDQPEAEMKKHAVYHEDLIFKMIETLKQTVEEFLENEPIVPVPAPSE